MLTILVLPGFSCATAEADKDGAIKRREALRAAREDAKRAEEEARQRAEAAVQEIQQTLSEIERARSELETDAVAPGAVGEPG